MRRSPSPGAAFASAGRLLFGLSLASVLLLALAPAVARAAPATAADANAGSADAAITALDVLLLHAPDHDQATQIAARLEAARLGRLQPTTRLLLNRSQRETGQGKLRDAHDDLDDAIALQPDQGLLWRERAAVSAIQGDDDGSVIDLGGALSRDPTDIQSWSGLSAIEGHRGEAKQAYAAWERVLRLDPMIPDGARRLELLRRRMVGDPT